MRLPSFRDLYKWNPMLDVTLLVLLFPLMLNVVHVLGFMNTFASRDIVEKSSYLERHQSPSFLYHSLFNLHRWTSVLWLLAGVINWRLSPVDRRSDSVYHKVIGYAYFALAILAPTFGEILLLYSPRLAGGNMMYYVLSITALYSYYTAYQMIYRIRRGEINRHRRWSFRNWFTTWAAIQTSALVTISVYLGMEVNQNNYRMAMVTTFFLSTFVQEMICNYMFPGENTFHDWFAFW